MTVQYPLNLPLGANLGAPITTNTGTQVKTGGGVFMGASVLAAGSGWTAAVYDGTSASGVPLATLECNGLGPIASPPIKFLTGLFVETAGTTAGSLAIAHF